MQYALKVFETEDHHEFRTINREGEPWFVLVDVCQSLDITNPRDAASRLDADEKDAVGITDAIGRMQRQTIINEAGLYSLILTSRKDSAKRFKKWVMSEVLPTIRKTGSYRPPSALPAFIRRANENWDRVEVGFFSIINELYTRLYGRFEMAGHTLADHAPDGTENRMDVSVGKTFAQWLDKNHPTLITVVGYYQHKTDQWEGPARQYPNSMLHLYIQFIEEVWIPQHAERYLKRRDAAALPYLQKILPSVTRPKPGMVRAPTAKTVFKRPA